MQDESNKNQDVASGSKVNSTDTGESLSAYMLALLTDVNNTSGAARNSWVVFISVQAFFIITLASIGHTDLLLNKAVNLPILQVQLPMQSFFKFAPVILIFMHLGILLQHVILSRKAKELHEILREREGTTGKARVGTPSDPIRRLIDSYFLTQEIAGPERSRLLAGLTKCVNWFTLSLLPLFVILYFQIAYLPYHDVAMTWAHRLYLIIDIGILLVMGLLLRYPSFGLLQAFVQRAIQHPLGTIGSTFLWLALITFSVAIATVPDEDMDIAMAKVWPTPVPWEENYNKRQKLLKEEGARTAFLPTAWLFEGKPVDATSNTSSPFSRNLIFIGKDIVEEKDLGETGHSLNLRGRDLRYGTFRHSDLQRSDMFGVNAKGADFSYVNFKQATLKTANFYGASLKSSVFNRADMEKTNLNKTNLRRASLIEANLKLATISGSDLEAVDLTKANIPRAKFIGSNLKFADLGAVHAEVTNFTSSNLDHANLVGAYLADSIFHTTSMRSVNLLGADIRSTYFYGANLTNTHFLGTRNSRYAWFNGSNMNGTRVWKNRPPRNIKEALAWVYLKPIQDGEYKIFVTQPIARIAKSLGLKKPSEATLEKDLAQIFERQLWVVNHRDETWPNILKYMKEFYSREAWKDSKDYKTWKELQKNLITHHYELNYPKPLREQKINYARNVAEIICRDKSPEGFRAYGVNHLAIPGTHGGFIAKAFLEEIKKRPCPVQKKFSKKAMERIHRSIKSYDHFINVSYPGFKKREAEKLKKEQEALKKKEAEKKAEAAN